jgi:hypothetical protein
MSNADKKSKTNPRIKLPVNKQIIPEMNKIDLIILQNPPLQLRYHA